MLKKIIFSILVLFFTVAMVACNEPPNPLLGKWHQVEPATNSDEVVEFTPSTMLIGNNRVTVIYQFRENQVRVSASKTAMIYTFTGPDTVTYDDDKIGTVTLARIKP